MFFSHRGARKLWRCAHSHVQNMVIITIPVDQQKMTNILCNVYIYLLNLSILLLDIQLKNIRWPCHLRLMHMKEVQNYFHLPSGNLLFY